MTSLHVKTIPIIILLLAFVLLGGPQLAAAQQQTNAQTGTTQPPSSSAQLPDAPQAQAVGTPALPQDAQPDQPDQQQQQNKDQQQQQNKKEQAPLGAAAAQKGVTAGGAASKPAGTAIAPAKQRQVRSWLLKLGMIAAGGAAIGTVLALTKGTSSVPPGSGR